MDLLQRRQQRGEQRKAVRHSLHFPAYITTANQAAHHNCVIHDISPLGARLTISAKADIPDEFTLVLRRTCRVVRRTDGQVGVQFFFADS